jgi:cytochrome P450
VDAHSLPRRQGGLPRLGDYLAFRRDPLGFWTETGGLGPVVPVVFGAQEFWVVTDAELVEHCLLTQAHAHPRDRRLMRINRGPGPELMFNTDRWEEWKRRRRLLQPAFNRSHLAGFGEVFVAEAERSVDQMVSSGGAVDVEARLRDMTMRIILKAMFSVEADAEVTRLQESFEAASEVVAARVSSPIPIPHWFPTPASRRLRRLMRYRWETLAGIVDSRIESGEERGDLLDLLLEARIGDDGLTEEDLVGEMSGIVFAGHETTAETQTWLLHQLAHNPDIEARLLDEIETVSPDGGPLTVEDVERMPFTNHVISETLRLYPPVYLTIRESDEAFDVDGLHIPAGTRLVINIRGLHRDPAAWDDPLCFDPDRFDRPHDRHRFQFLPFLGGPRKCLGDHFAMLEMRLTVPTLLRRLRFEYVGPPNLEPVAGFTLATPGGMRMRAHPR